MVPLNKLDSKSIMSREVLDEVFNQEDEIYRAELLASLALRASELRCKTEFTSVVNAYKKVQKDIKRQEREDIQRQLKEASLVEHYTNFTDSPYDRMACGNWIAADDGICTWNSTTGITDVRACYHPILPVERLKNIQTG